MIEVSKVSYEVIAMTEKGVQLNITQAVENLGWEDNEDELAVKISFDMFNASYDGSKLSSLIKIGAVVAVKAYWGSGKGIVAMGTIIECTRKTSKSAEAFDVVAWDNLYNLQKSADCFYFTKGKKTKSILTSIFKDWGITISKYDGPNVSHAKVLEKNKKIGEVVRGVLDEAKKKGGGSAIVRSTQLKVEVVKKGSNKEIYCFQSNCATEASHKISIADIVTRVKVVSSEDSEKAAKVEATVNGKTSYGVFQKIVTKSKSDSIDDAKKEAKSIIDEQGKPKETSKLIGPDVPPIRKGDLIYAKTGTLNGFFLVKSVQHNAKAGKITMDVEMYKPENDSASDKGKEKKKDYKPGDIVQFNGGKHYVSSWPNAKGYNATAGKAKILFGPDCKGNGKAHPWCLESISGSSSNVCGWVDEGTFQ